MIAERRATFEKLVKDITARGLAANWYTIPAFTGYAPLTDGQPVDVDCAEVCLGPAVNKPGYDAYVVAQAFLSKYPSLILTTLTELRHEDRKPSPDRFTFDVEIDKKVSTIFLPIMHTAFNHLDPSGANRGLLVQTYYSEITWSDLILASGYSLALLLRFKKDGQLAQIATDITGTAQTIVTNTIRPLMFLVKGDVHFIMRTKTLSDLKIPIRNPNGGHYLIEHSSTAVDQAFRIAFSYLDEHYRKHGFAGSVEAAQPLLETK